MYEHNYLVERLRRSTIGAEDTRFLFNHQTGATVTYGEFFANAERMAAVLVEAGITPGDRVAVQAPKTQAMLELYVGTLLAGAVFLPLNTAYTGAEISYFLNDARPRLLVCDPDKLGALAAIAQQSGVAEILTIAADESGSLTQRRDSQAPGFQPVPRGPDDLAAILYTSGTTGRSKGAMLTHRALASNSETLTAYWRF
ncbi:AMP-binding protein, partial [Pseudorhodobacter sp.]|uniref:AMP-binding protein n=1 Tax=Pseudorhodobacter sp. TaxID=1934400 RepID=UPI002648C90F